jgi:ABC-type oligopeptide transport system substrate-binding subunit
VNRGRFFVKGQAVFWYLNFNHDEPLFRGNNRLKQAINHAIDRPQMVRQHGALGGARTDQILPIDFPGFRNWNLYSLRGANPTRARQLAQGNTRGGKVRFWTFNSSFGPSVAQVVQFNLRQINLDADITALDRVVQTTRGGNRNTNDYDMLLNGWGEDYPDPYDFINILLQGTSIQPDNNVNLSYFNEARWNARMTQAASQFGAQRLRTYAILDRDLMQGPAPVAPYINTNARILVSARVRNHIFHKVYGTDFAALNLVG